MREAANQHNIFICTRIRRFAGICGPLGICQIRTMAGTHIKFKWHQRLAHARSR